MFLSLSSVGVGLDGVAWTIHNVFLTGYALKIAYVSSANLVQRHHPSIKNFFARIFLRTMHSCTRALPPTVPNRAHSSFCGEARNERAVVVGRTRATTLPRDQGKSGRPGGGHPASHDRPLSHTSYDGGQTGRRACGPSASKRPPRAIRKQTTTTGHPHADDHHGPSARRRPRAVRKQAITGRPQADDHGPSASRRLPAVRPQTTSGHPQTTSGHPPDYWRRSEDGCRDKKE